MLEFSHQRLFSSTNGFVIQLGYESGIEVVSQNKGLHGLWLLRVAYTAGDQMEDGVRTGTKRDSICSLVF